MRLTKIEHYYKSYDDEQTYKRVEVSDGEFNWLKWEWNDEYDGRWSLIVDEDKISKLESKHQEEKPK
jgi:hypothetical protein